MRYSTWHWHEANTTIESTMAEETSNHAPGMSKWVKFTSTHVHAEELLKVGTSASSLRLALASRASKVVLAEGDASSNACMCRPR